MRYGREFWRKLSAEVDEGSPVAEVARRHNVQARTLSWWRWRLKQLGRTGPMLLPVVVRRVEETARPSAIEVQLRDLIIRVPSDTDVAYVAELIAALRS